MDYLRSLLFLCCVLYVMSMRKDQMDSDCCLECVCQNAFALTRTTYEVVCSYRNLTEVPRCQWQNVTHLDLRGNNISKISKDTLQRMKHIQDLDLSKNRLSYLPDPSVTMVNLKTLKLDGNQFTKVPVNALSRMINLQILKLSHNYIENVNGSWEQRKLTTLYLDHNNISKIPHFAPKIMPRLRKLSFSQNHIQGIPERTFENLNKLDNLILSHNKLRFVHPNFMGNNSGSLKYLDLYWNHHLKNIPFEGIKKLKNLERLRIAETNITEIPDFAFQGLDNLKVLDLEFDHHPRTINVGSKAFSFLPRLITLALTSFGIKQFPNLTDMHSLENLILHGNEIESLPDNFCETMPELEDLDLSLNKIKVLPSLANCRELLILKLDHNRIRSFGSSLHGLEKIRDITAKYNSIESIGENDFKDLSMLETLNLEDNQISSIHKKAFSHFTNIQSLNLAGSNFPELPTVGLQTVTFLSIKGNSKLTQFPSLKHIPNIKELRLHYPYHCCAFLKKAKVERNAYLNSTKIDFLQAEFTWLGYNESEDPFGEFEPSGNGLDPTTTAPTEVATDNIICTPEPDPFFPCEDLMGDWVLRCGVWIVFVLALCGNATVILVILASHTKMDVSRFLISNLAFADLFMGIYLGFLAVVDISTLGNFKNYGVEWQASSGCRTAGFLAILSSELSVFTLTVITLERYIAIKNAIRVNRKLQLKTAIIVMIVGWVFAIVTATLPLLEVNSYGKFSVCLPFEIGDTKSIVFLVFLLCLNATAFVVILFCYILMYCSIRGSNAWNASDFRVAKRMALLVFTDFACWAPIVFLSLTAAFGSTIVNLSQAKIFTVFVFPLNSCANPFLYAIFTSHFKKDLLAICKRVEEKYPFLKMTKQRTSFSRRSSYSGAVSAENPHLYVKIRRCSLPVFPKGFNNSITTHGRGTDSSNKNSSETNGVNHDFQECLLTERETSV